MNYSLLCYGLIVFIMWIIVVNLIKLNLQLSEERSKIPRQFVDVLLCGYDIESNPNMILAQTCIGNDVVIADYDQRYRSIVTSSIGKHAHITFSLRFTGLIWLQMSQQIYTLDIID